MYVTGYSGWAGGQNSDLHESSVGCEGGELVWVGGVEGVGDWQSWSKVATFMAHAIDT